MWSRDGVALISGTPVSISTNHVEIEDGIYSSTSTLFISMVELSYTGNYMCQIIQEDLSLRQPLQSSAGLQVIIRSRSTYNYATTRTATVL